MINMNKIYDSLKQNKLFNQISLSTRHQLQTDKCRVQIGGCRRYNAGSRRKNIEYRSEDAQGTIKKAGDRKSIRIHFDRNHVMTDLKFNLISQGNRYQMQCIKTMELSEIIN